MSTYRRAGEDRIAEALEGIKFALWSCVIGIWSIAIHFIFFS